MLNLDRNGNGHRSLAGSNGNGQATPSGAEREVRIRSLAGADASELRALAERDTARMPNGAVVGAERDGRLLAAISLSSGEVVADPFHPTADLVALLRLRAGQIIPLPA